MTKEELEKEAEEKYSEVDREFITCQDEGEVFNIGYVLGAEPREKRIKELETRCNELFFQVNEKIAKIDELEKENAELKRDKEDLIFIRNQNAKCMCEDKENLAKAKELLKHWANSYGYIDIALCKQTQQFLREVEK